uniref:Glucan endo-1,3-beta-D-glucosidase n=1 Tax=Arundo donax TaxID=35708 RepID=A0A0A9HFG8_ARUDO
MPIAVTEIGWPTAGHAAATPQNAAAYNAKIVERAGASARRGGPGCPWRRSCSTCTTRMASLAPSSSGTSGSSGRTGARRTISTSRRVRLCWTDGRVLLICESTDVLISLFFSNSVPVTWIGYLIGCILISVLCFGYPKEQSTMVPKYSES